MRYINYHFRLLNPIVWRPGGAVGRESGFGDISASVPGVAVYICVPEVCRIKEARYGDTRSARLTADESANLETSQVESTCNLVVSRLRARYDQEKHKPSATHLESVTEKGDRSPSTKSYSDSCGKWGAGQFPSEAAALLAFPSRASRCRARPTRASRCGGERR